MQQGRALKVSFHSTSARPAMVDLDSEPRRTAERATRRTKGERKVLSGESMAPPCTGPHDRMRGESSRHADYPRCSPCGSAYSAVRQGSGPIQAKFTVTRIVDPRCVREPLRFAQESPSLNFPQALDDSLERIQSASQFGRVDRPVQCSDRDPYWGVHDDSRTRH